MIQDLVSVIIPVYNIQKEYLNVCFNSLIKQTYNNFEVIIIDDGSIDNLASFVDECANKDSRFRVIHKKNQGVSAARNDGLAISQGQYVIFVDGDDWLEPTAIERLINFRMLDNAEFVVANNYYEYETHREKRHDIEDAPRRYRDGEIRRLSLSTITPSYELKYYDAHIGMIRGVWGKLYCANIIKKNGIFFKKNLTIGEDSIFNAEYLDKISSATFINEYLYHYRVINESANRRYNENIVEARINLLKEYKRQFDIQKKDIATCYRKEVLSCVLNCLSKFYCNPKCPLSFRVKLKYIKQLTMNSLFMEAFDLNVDNSFFSAPEYLVGLSIKYHIASLLYLFGILFRNRK